jgi:diguanylate cyclase (GGDEF)-like protein/PAS domain S-box-containing protein
VTTRKAAELALKEREEHFRHIVETTREGMWTFDSAGRTTYVNPRMAELLGAADSELLAGSIFDFIAPDERALMQASLDRRSAGMLSSEMRFIRRNAQEIWALVSTSPLLDSRGEYLGMLAMIDDITERKTFEKQLSQLAFFDQLTGLPNRGLLLDRLGQAVARHGRTEGSVAVLFLDLDNFKLINDSLGHEAGDRVLCAVADRLRATLRAEDTAARVGGDEFVVVLDSVNAPIDALQAAERIAESVRRPLLIGEQELFLGISTGIAVGARLDPPETLIRQADLAMYRAKSRREGPVLFDDAMGRGLVERLAIQTDLRHALERDELRLHYQPIVDLADGKIREVEALLRWQHPQQGLVPPLSFIGIAEETGLIVPIGRWVLEQALSELVAWGAAADGIGLSVNLSSRQFRDPALVTNIAQALERTNVAAARLTLEITESVLMEEDDATSSQLASLRALGVRLAIDDFGTGYSSLAYLSRFPVDTLKIDRSFVKDITGGMRAQVDLVRGIVALARTLDLSIVAEGVETVEQRNMLLEFGCPLAQGYLFAKPMAGPAMATLLAHRSTTGPPLVA